MNSSEIRLIFIYAIVSFFIWGLGFAISYMIPYESLYFENVDLAENGLKDCERIISSYDASKVIIWRNLKCAFINCIGFCSFGFTTFCNLLYNNSSLIFE